MSELTMCRGELCPLKDKCFRHTAKIKGWGQIWFGFAPYDAVKKSCKHFSDNTGIAKALQRVKGSQGKKTCP